MVKLLWNCGTGTEGSDLLFNDWQSVYAICSLGSFWGYLERLIYSEQHVRK